MSDHPYLQQAVALARQNVRAGGRPFGAVLVVDDAVVATGVNRILATGDPSAHAELSAIRQACLALGRTRLDGARIYASGQPCPMCLAAMHLVGISEVYFAYSNAQAEPFGLSTAGVYAQMTLPLEAQSIRITHQSIDHDLALYREWQAALT